MVIHNEYSYIPNQAFIIDAEKFGLNDLQSGRSQDDTTGRAFMVDAECVS